MANIAPIMGNECPYIILLWIRKAVGGYCMNTSEAVKNRVIELCMAKRWSFNALAEYSGIPSSTMTNILNGKSQNPGVVTIKKICDGLEITLSEFFSTPVFDGLEQEIK